MSVAVDVRTALWWRSAMVVYWDDSVVPRNSANAVVPVLLANDSAWTMINAVGRPIEDRRTYGLVAGSRPCWIFGHASSRRKAGWCLASWQDRQSAVPAVRSFPWLAA